MKQEGPAVLLRENVAAKMASEAARESSLHH